MKLVLDSNIFISAFYWGGNPQEVINRIIEGLDELYVSNEILAEISEVMMRPKFKTDMQTIDTYIKAIEKAGKKVFITGKVKEICRDKDDNTILECGLLSGAEYIITGDDDLLSLKRYQNIKIISVHEYLKINRLH